RPWDAIPARPPRCSCSRSWPSRSRRPSCSTRCSSSASASVGGVAMNALLLLAPDGGGGPVEQIARTFGVDWTHLIAQIVSFGIVCALLYRFAYRPILAMLAQRREQIAQGMANAEQIKAELARTESQRQVVIAQANAEAARLIEEARAAATRVQKE